MNETLSPKRRAFSPSGIDAPAVFQGFPLPTSNTTYTPNQFFDVVLPHHSRGAVRLVAFLIRKTLGWSDAHGNPRETEIRVSYRQLIESAGISREMIREAIDEAIAARLIRCVRPGRAKGLGTVAESAMFELCWDETGTYTTDRKAFRGFFAGEGHRTHIPNAFFDHTVRTEPLAVSRVVGAIVRHTIGFQTKYGFRRQQVQMSLTTLERRTGLSHRALRLALERAVASGYVLRLEEGFFDPNAGTLSRATVYGLRWRDSATGAAIGQKSTLEPERSEKYPGISPKSTPEDRSEKYPDIETTGRNNTNKQQDAADAAGLLRREGFSAADAKRLAAAHGRERVEQQIDWLKRRNPSRNRLGMLRRAIEENWPEPVANVRRLTSDSAAARFVAHFYAGQAGSTGKPVAQPSRAEIEAAEALVARLQSVASGAEQAETWGREFGAWARERSTATTPRAFTFALRTHGDGFLRHVQAQQTEQALREREERQEAHRAAFEAAWIAYLRQEDERLRQERPQTYRAFEAERERQRQVLQTERWQINREQRLNAFDTESKRLADFQHFLNHEVLGFWDWDARLNPQPFTEPKA